MLSTVTHDVKHYNTVSTWKGASTYVIFIKSVTPDDS